MFGGLHCTQNFQRDRDVHDSLNSVRLTADSRRQNDVGSEGLAVIFREQCGSFCADDVGL